MCMGLQRMLCVCVVHPHGDLHGDPHGSLHGSLHGCVAPAGVWACARRARRTARTHHAHGTRTARRTARRKARTRAHLERLEHDEASDDGVGRGDGGHDLARDLLDLPARLARDVEDLRAQVRGGGHQVERLRVVLVELQPAALLGEVLRALGVHGLDGAEEDLRAYSRQVCPRPCARHTPGHAHGARIHGDRLGQGGRGRRGGPLRSPRGSTRADRPRRGRRHRAASSPPAAAPRASHAPSTTSPGRGGGGDGGGAWACVTVRGRA